MANKPSYRLHPTTWEDIELQEGAHEDILREHGLDKSLWHRPGLANLGELERQIDYLLRNHHKIPPTTANRQAVKILTCYSQSGKAPPPNLATIFGQLMKVWELQVKYAKKSTTRILAQQYLSTHPNATDTEIAEEVGVNRSTVYRWRKDGKLSTSN